MTTKKDKRGFAADLAVSITGDGYWLRIEDLIVEPENNGRACIFTYEGQPSCFEVADVDDLLNEDPTDEGSLVNAGQQTAVKIWLDGNGRPHLCQGFRRHFALTVARNSAPAIAIPTPKGKEGRILCSKIDRPKTEADQLRLRRLNIAENVKRRPLSPLDVAVNFAAYTKSLAEGGFGLSKKDAADELDVSISHANKCLRVLGASPKFKTEWLPKLHRDECTIAQACAAMVEKGEGSTHGSQSGVRKSAVKLAFKGRASRPPPTVELGAAGVEALISILFGQSEISDKTPARVREWHSWVNASKTDVPATKAKKAPPSAAPLAESKPAARPAGAPARARS